MVKRAPLLSVIIPIYKVESFLRECLDSVLVSRYTNLEVILVDDGSPDGSPQICDEYAARDPRVVVIHQENRGASDARNRGIRAANGEYITFVDGDDMWGDCAAICEVVSTLNEHPEIDLMCFDCDTLLESGALRTKPPYDTARVNGLSKREALEYFIGEDRLLVTPWSKIIRRSLILENGLKFRCGIRSEDYDWTLQLLMCSDVIWAFPRNFYTYRVWSGSVTSNISELHLYDILSIIRDWKGKISALPDSTPEKSLYFDVLAYIYGVLLSLAYIAPSAHLLRTLRSYVHLLESRRSPKVRKVYKLYRAVGFGLCWRLLGLFNRFRSR